ncbi:hypothetical protein AVEN_121671-1 [Araneus ventricosus]|uniref:Uncharacterized protein n=1 Tax=Araneus ventricosus TaxID=182803 RepID=A0A4Y2VKF5_ARAVE|nr:hypothetical protein AVEN_121671-1 [Araneus ventricosus]
MQETFFRSRDRGHVLLLPLFIFPVSHYKYSAFRVIRVKLDHLQLYWESVAHVFRQAYAKGHTVWLQRTFLFGFNPIFLKKKEENSDFSLQQACHKFVMTRLQACSKLTKASKSPWNELAASLPQVFRANSLQIIAKTEYEHNPG